VVVDADFSPDREVLIFQGKARVAAQAHVPRRGELALGIAVLAAAGEGNGVVVEGVVLGVLAGAWVGEEVAAIRHRGAEEEVDVAGLLGWQDPGPEHDELIALDARAGPDGGIAFVRGVDAQRAVLDADRGIAFDDPVAEAAGEVIGGDGLGHHADRVERDSLLAPRDLHRQSHASNQQQ